MPREGGLRDLAEAGLPALEGEVIANFEDLVERGGLAHSAARGPSRLRSAPFLLDVPEQEVEHRLADLERHPRIAAATRNWRVSLEDAGVGLQAVHEFVLRHGLVHPPPMAAPLRPVHVVVVDSGVDADAVCCEQLTPDQLNVGDIGRPIRSAPYDDDGHGSTVASLIHLLNPQATITSIRCFSNGRGTLADVVDGLLLGLLLDEPVDIFNCSFKIDVSVEVCPQCQHPTMGPSAERSLRRLLDHIRFTSADEPVFVAAAGNEGPRIAMPGALEGVVAVGSTGASNATHPQPDPRYSEVPPLFLLAAGGSRNDPVGRSAASGRLLCGTSFATAMVSGAASRLVSEGWNLRNEPPGQKGAFLLTRLEPYLWRTFPGYDRAVHGAGVLTH